MDLRPARGVRVRAPTGKARQHRAGRLLLIGGELDAGSVPHRNPGSEALGYRLAPDVAEHLAIDGLDPDFLGDIAGFSGLDSRDVLDFAGIDRTTVAARPVAWRCRKMPP